MLIKGTNCLFWLLVHLWLQSPLLCRGLISLAYFTAWVYDSLLNFLPYTGGGLALRIYKLWAIYSIKFHYANFQLLPSSSLHPLLNFGGGSDIQTLWTPISYYVSYVLNFVKIFFYIGFLLQIVGLLLSNISEVRYAIK